LAVEESPLGHEVTVVAMATVGRGRGSFATAKVLALLINDESINTCLLLQASES